MRDVGVETENSKHETSFPELHNGDLGGDKKKELEEVAGEERSCRQRERQTRPQAPGTQLSSRTCSMLAPALENGTQLFSL